MVTEGVPYVEENLEDNVYIRTFAEDTLEEELKWHWDEEDRVIHPLHPTNWSFQIDNQLPETISKSIFIPAGEWHRVIKGTGDLTVKVVKIIK